MRLADIHVVVELVSVVVTAAVAARLWSRLTPGPVPPVSEEASRGSWPSIELARQALRELEAMCPATERDVRVNDSRPALDLALPGVQRDTRRVPAVQSRATACALGCPRLIDVDGRRVTGLRETALELLVYLVVHRNGVPIERIRRDVYAVASPQRASERFSTDLANLRDRLRAAAGVGRDVNPVPCSGGRYRLLPDVLAVDWWQALDDWRLVESTDERETEVALRRLTSAFADGVLADGAGYEWLADVQEQSRRLGVAAHVRLADLVASREQGEAAALLGRACDLDPFDEDLARRAIAACLAVGDRGAAASRYAVLQEALAVIDEEPEQETVDLMAHVI